MFNIFNGDVRDWAPSSRQPGLGLWEFICFLAECVPGVMMLVVFPACTAVAFGGIFFNLKLSLWALVIMGLDAISLIAIMGVLALVEHLRSPSF